MATEIRPISIDIAFSDDGTTAKGASVVEAVYVDGDFMRVLPPKPLTESTVAAVLPYASAFAASAIAQVAVLTAERNEAFKSTETVRATMQAEIDRLTALIPPPVDPNAVPAMITRTQARLVLHRAGLLDKVLEIIAAGGVEAQIWYEANEWYRASPVLAGMALALGFTDEQVDNLFRAAGAIVP